MKPDRLTYSEFKEIKKHTVIGSRAIGKVISSNDLKNEYLYMAMDICLCHHEKYDGRGYLNGFTGDHIPLPARIFAVVDAYGVITSKRPYKVALGHEDALKRISKDSRKHFDPKTVDIFIKSQYKFKEIYERYHHSDL